MKAGFGALLFLVYSFAISMGTPAPLLALQALGLVIAGTTVTVQAFRQRSMIFPTPFLLLLLASIAFVCLSMMLSLGRGQTPAPVMVRFLQVYISTFTIPLLSYCFVSLGEVSNEQVLRHLVNAVMAYTYIKLLIVAVVAVLNIPQIVIVKFFELIFNADPAFGIFFLNIARFFGPTDFLSVFALYFFLFLGKGRLRIIWILALCASIFVSYSRFVWLEGIFVIALYGVRLSRGQIFALLTSLILVAPVATFVPTTLIEERFASANAQKSDDIRTHQVDALTQDVDQNFLLGHGFASFSYKMVRDKQAPYSYEEQWLSIIYQFGIVGLLMILVLLVSVLTPLLENITLDGVALALLFGFSLLSGFANPSLIGRAAGMGFAMVYFCATNIRDRARERLWSNPTKTLFRSL